VTFVAEAASDERTSRRGAAVCEMTQYGRVTRERQQNLITRPCTAHVTSI